MEEYAVFKGFRENLVVVVVDEVHKVTWGACSTDHEKPFREAYSQISVLRSSCREKKKFATYWVAIQ